MSRIRFTKAAEPTTPNEGKSWFWVDADDHLKRKRDDGSVVDYDATNSQDAIATVLSESVVDTATIDLNYDLVNNELTADIVNSSITDAQIDKISPAKIESSQNKYFESSMVTMDNLEHPIISLDCAVAGSWMIEAKVMGRRIGGAAGNDGDSAVFRRTFRIKSINGVVTVHDFQSDYTSRDNSNYKFAYDIVGTNVNINVCGDTDNNVKWNLNLISNINI